MPTAEEHFAEDRQDCDVGEGAEGAVSVVERVTEHPGYYEAVDAEVCLELFDALGDRKRVCAGPFEYYCTGSGGTKIVHLDGGEYRLLIRKKSELVTLQYEQEHLDYKEIGTYVDKIEVDVDG